MDPNFNGVWSASEIDMVKSFIASHNTNNTYTSNALVNDNFGTPTEDTNMDNMFHGYILDDVEAMKMVEEPPHKLNIVPKKRRQNPVIAWTQDEHKNFLRGLEVFGRGSWKNISRYFVPTRTPIQICSHAQKYFHRKECTTRKQRFTINDVGLYDIEPRVQKNSSSLEALAFGRSAYNTNYYDFEGQHTVLNKLAHASQESSRQVATWTRGQHIIGSSFIDPTTVQTNSLGWEALAFTSSANNINYYEFDGQYDAMNNLACANQATAAHGALASALALLLAVSHAAHTLSDAAARRSPTLPQCRLLAQLSCLNHRPHACFAPMVTRRARVASARREGQKGTSVFASACLRQL
ncbi:transcription factor MYB1R1-like [Miscanthus floridulus]|uniref:transcription factor MYB1R1-like n=1 Tax=Miscanthus floridulus TaxID=154761 RepID=UPI0034574008